MVANQDLAQDQDLRRALLTARRGTDFFGRKLSDLSDDEFAAPSLLPGWTRAHVIAHVGYNARAIARLIEWANTGVETPMYSSRQARNEEIEHGATLSPVELRDLYEQSANQLDVAWRNTPQEAWAHEVKAAQGYTAPAAETVWWRTREVWIHAVDLDNGASFADMPSDVLERLLKDITGAWHKRGDDKNLRLDVLGSGGVTQLGDATSADPVIVTGTLPDITAWAAGRSTRGITSNRPDTLQAPRWI
ncbi:maleylpyruvate isomerase family mycothiol-dependent enzyme [Arthrobacter sp. CAU 1506]|uniref:maleylpyruvate isomerase family mycothiol-dependent enzyme n=1 Tax=Arthrobacter sp. CAU 1506 TaxID=2560052 RepID=UPI0010ACA38D|nr:maleylpyruvate isomerase family mycothiol-dependent enzyme [Arthrobacter sp. CAU 1506]TJY69075.1 maleylpyruvate isomerase family mycothiol-dependent enzyme [Arthrobacter sp. CAU 1506]